MFVVGGFAESPLLQASLRREFGHILRVLIPQEVGLVILKGKTHKNISSEWGPKTCTGLVSETFDSSKNNRRMVEQAFYT